LFQESVSSLYPTSLDMLGLVQIFVPKEQAELADIAMKEYFDAMENE